jgi:hypothetical protein
MTATSPPEAFLLAEPDEFRRPASPAALRIGNGAMVAGTAALISGVLIDMAGGVLVANAPSLFLTIGQLRGPLIACGQVLLVGGAIAARLARRRMTREGVVHETDRRDHT